MIDIVTYINEGGFFANTGVNKYIDTIKNFGNIISTEAVKKELKTASFLSSTQKTNIYKKLYDLFNNIKKYEVRFDVKYIFENDTCTEHYVCIRNGNKFSLSFDRIFEKRTDNNVTFYDEYKDASELLCWILYYISITHDLNVLRDTAKFTIK